MNGVLGTSEGTVKLTDPTTKLVPRWPSKMDVPPRDFSSVIKALNVGEKYGVESGKVECIDVSLNRPGSGHIASGAGIDNCLG